MEIPYPTCPTWSHFIQDKLKIAIYLSLDKCKICRKLINFVFHILINYYEFTWCIENSVDPDQLASSWFHAVLESVNCLITDRYKLICTIGQVKFSLNKYIMALYLPLDK